jgi:hypothetical protein
MIRRIGYLLDAWIIGVFGLYQIYNNPVDQPTNKPKLGVNMDNIRTNMGTDFTAIAFDTIDYMVTELDSCTGNMCNPDDLVALAAFLKKWAVGSGVTVDLSID